MKIKTLIFLSTLTILFSTSCFEDRDDNGVFASEINDFVWKGMNTFYLYKVNIPDLANDRFSSGEEYGVYLNSYDTPEILFESLIYDRQNVDKYSWITDDYIALEQLFDGETLSNGMKYVLTYYPNSTSQVYGYVRYVVDDSNAESQGLERGIIFNEIDGISLYYNSSTDNNLSLITGDNITLGLASYDTAGTPLDLTDDTIVSNSETVTLTKTQLTENPVYRTQIFEVNGENVGYLMYNRFTSDFDGQLNAAFGTLASNNVQHLILDLRYNPGGSVLSASYLGSMVTGQFDGQVFSKIQYNNNFEDRIYYFKNQLSNGTTINSLNLDKVYVLTTGTSASASEAVINSLSEYITVEHIGTTTEGKTQASRTVYDSEDFNREGVNPNHTYAMQPLVGISVDKNNGQVPSTGIVPTIELGEHVTNLGVLGDVNEPLLARALSEIEGASKFFTLNKPVYQLADDYSFIKFAKEMYIE